MTGRDDATRSAERAVLGAMLFHPSAINEALAYLDAEQFAEPRHGYVYVAITALHARGVPAGVPAVLDELARLGNLHGALDGPFVMGLVTDSCLTAQVGYYAAIISREARSGEWAEVAATVRRALNHELHGTDTAALAYALCGLEKLVRERTGAIHALGEQLTALAVEREIARRATDGAWERELKRREEIRAYLGGSLRITR